MIIRTDSADATRDVGEAVGRLSRDGDVIVLEGDLGSGKTTFTQGVGRGMAIPEPITSPTFVVMREHRGPERDLVHVDAYRIGSLPEWDDLDIDLEGAVSIIEWGNRVAPALPSDCLTIVFVADDDSRELQISAGGPRSRRLLDALEGSR